MDKTQAELDLEQLDTCSVSSVPVSTKVPKVAYIDSVTSYIITNPDKTWNLDVQRDRRTTLERLQRRGCSLEEATFAVSSSKQFHCLELHPDRPTEFVTSDGRNVLNTYQSSNIIPKDQPFPTFQLIIDTLTDNEPATKEWLCSWMAAKYQNPARFMRTAPVFVGSPGSGKGTLSVAMRNLLGKQNCATPNLDLLKSPFNGFMDSIFIQADEVTVNDRGFEIAEKLKHYVADTDILVTLKNKNPRPVKNMTAWWINSNHSFAVRLDGDGDRRYSIFDNRKPLPLNHEANLIVFQNDTVRYTTELEGLAFFLKNYPVNETILYSSLKNQARQDIVDATKTSTLAFFDTAIEDGYTSLLNKVLHCSNCCSEFSLRSTSQNEFKINGKRVIATNALYAAYKHFCHTEGRDGLSKQRFVEDLKQQPNALRVQSSKNTWGYTVSEETISVVDDILHSVEAI